MTAPRHPSPDESAEYMPHPAASPRRRGGRLPRSAPPITVLLNSHFEIAAGIRRHAAKGERIRFVFFSRRPARQLRAFMGAGDRYVREPIGGDRAYATAVVALARTHRLTVVMPGRRVAALATIRSDLEAVGTVLVIAGSAPLLELLADKARCYARLESLSGLLPRYGTAGSLPEFRALVAALGASGTICFKPTRSIYGVGFHIVGPVRVDPALRRRVLSFRQAETFFSSRARRSQIVMEFLPGAERSIDCLASRGQLVGAVIRRKYADGSQLIEQHPALLRAVARICETLGLDGLFNVQFKDDRTGNPRLLEINGRMAGGISKSFASGVVLPLWAIRLAIHPDRHLLIPNPRTGILVPPTDHRSAR